MDRLQIKSVSLSNYVNEKFFYGIKTGFNEAFIIDEKIKNNLLKESPECNEIIKPFLIGRDVKRYKYENENRFIIFSRRGINIKEYPAIYNYLSQFKEKLMPKPKNWKGQEWKGRKPGAYQWYEIQDSIDYYLEFEKEKIIYPNICKRPEFTIDVEGFYANQKCFIISKNDKYLLGILNSSVMMFFFRTTIPKLRGDFYEPGYVFMKNFPVHKIDFTNPAEIEKHDRMVNLVERMLELHKREPLTPQEADRLEREISATDAAIDQLVYDLYGLTEEEIKIIES
jgi:hypothetical protein